MQKSNTKTILTVVNETPVQATNGESHNRTYGVEDPISLAQSLEMSFRIIPYTHIEQRRYY